MFSFKVAVDGEWDQSDASGSESGQFSWRRKFK